MSTPTRDRTAAGRRPGRLRRNRRGVFLLEVMLAVAIFSLAVLALGRCLSNCLEAAKIRAEEVRARQALENRMAEICASQAVPATFNRRTLTGPFTGMTLVEKRRALDFKNEQNVNLTGLYEVTLSAEWNSGGQTYARQLTFFLLRQGA